ncbi:ribonuclease R [Methyloceanibacter superfactus]|uniref:Ribonuclease R n=1 Tax=Methyloceanibacter superfactus TaxID=1774969 RepID=A0A1E3VSC2_9HYPH|nr:ribonuclease R [Methyloceanibacter superfactus]
MARPKQPAPKKKAAPAKSGSKAAGKLPSKQEILDFLKESTAQAGKREIARAFGIKGAERIALKALLRDRPMKAHRRLQRKLSRPGDLPPVTVLEITARDADGEFIARPATWDEEHGTPPRILMVESKRDGAVAAAGIGDRVLAAPHRARRRRRLSLPGTHHQTSAADHAQPARHLPRAEGRPRRHRPVDKKQLKEWTVPRGSTGDAENGELVRFEMARSARYGIPTARVVERLGNPEAQQATSLIAIHAHGIPDTFPTAVIAAADAAKEPELGRREDLRDIPLVTIDPSDARDHDDAVWAEADPDPKNRGGWVVIVAIADVSHYVTPGSPLDEEARKRGNSVYFPDRVVPMLPERISNDLCSLKEDVARPCLAVRMTFDKDGRKLRHRFVRGLMRSAASLSYEQAQAAIDGRTDETTGPLFDTVLRPLWGAYASLVLARTERGPLDLDLPERKILLDDKGKVRGVTTPPRLDAHRLIEEFMIAANVAAAETWEAKRTPLIYRVHDEPSKEKLASLAEFLATIGLKLPKAGTLRPAQFNRILAETRATPTADLVAEVVLRSQSQAEYSPNNFGHFGLNLRRYAHFTSPIRRYADLIVHRALIRALDLGAGGLTDTEIGELEEIATAISATERRAMAAERDTTDRLIAAYLATRIGAQFPARVSGLVRTGLFVRLAETGADGFVPASGIGHEYFYHDEVRQALVGEDTGLAYQLGDPVDVRLVEAIPTAGALRFDMLSEGRKIGIKPGRPRNTGFQGRPQTKGRPQAKGRPKTKGKGRAPRKRR